MRKLLVGILFVFIPCTAFSSEHAVAGKRDQEARFSQIFHSLDTDNSGKLSRDEVALRAPPLAENFDQMDANHDGELTRKEIKDVVAAAEKRRQEFVQHLDAADKDKNGKLTRDEARVLPNISANFDAIDSNHDGELVMKEIADYVRARAVATQAPVAASTVP